MELNIGIMLIGFIILAVMHSAVITSLHMDRVKKQKQINKLLLKDLKKK